MKLPKKLSTKSKVIIAAGLLAPLLILLIVIQNGPSYKETKLTASDGAKDDNFSHSVAIDGDTVVVGSICDDNGRNCGSVYIQKWDGVSWNETKLTASDGAKGDRFGSSVAIDGDTVVVGAIWDDDNGSNSGSAYIYKWDGATWKETKLTASDGTKGDRFGESVAVSGDTVVVGAVLDNDNGEESGSAYIYRWDGVTWKETKLTASDGAKNDWFGYSVAIDGDTVVVGAVFDDDKIMVSGSVYIYKWDSATWTETKLTASDGAKEDQFGWSVAVSGDTVAVGARCDDDEGASSGSAYIYKWNGATWKETKLIASDGVEGDFFGHSVAINGDTVVVGAFLGDKDNFRARLARRFKGSIGKWLGDGGHDSGSAYIYKWNGTTWEETILTATDSATKAKFGHSIAINNEVIVVGANYDNNKNGDNAGAIYIYRPKD